MTVSLISCFAMISVGVGISVAAAELPWTQTFLVAVSDSRSPRNIPLLRTEQVFLLVTTIVLTVRSIFLESRRDRKKTNPGTNTAETSFTMPSSKRRVFRLSEPDYASIQKALAAVHTKDNSFCL